MANSCFDLKLYPGLIMKAYRALIGSCKIEIDFWLGKTKREANCICLL
ncbi:hypothetical protein SynBIOSE41_02422 [Synechococcus sp. BIOS-E4-1]|nr:hypothetical protein SynBIOSE41_02422 [Synechococcus sp. BIOS-E4-1]